MKIDISERTEILPNSFKMHSSMCLELNNLVVRIIRIFPDIEDARPGSSSGIQTLCLLYKSLEKAKLLLRYCSESSKLYMAVTGNAILLRGYKAKKSLEEILMDIQNMVLTDLAIKISHIVQDLRSTILTLESSEEEVGKSFRELMRRSKSSSVSWDEIRDFHYAAMKLHLTTSESILIERRSLESLLEKLSDSREDKRKILKYLLFFLKKHERIISKYPKQHHQPFKDLVSVSVVVESKEHNVTTLPEEFKCPISLVVMYDPVIISSGHTFERMWIQKWFDEGKDSCPKSKQRLNDFTITPNKGLKDQISKWCEKQGLAIQDPSMKKSLHNAIDFSDSIASFGNSLCNIPDLSCYSSMDSLNSPSYSKMSKNSGYFMPMSTIDSDSGTIVTDSSQSEVDFEPLNGLNELPWDAQIKTIKDLRSNFEQNTRAFRFISSPSKFLKQLNIYLKNAHERDDTSNGEILKNGLDLLLAFLSGNTKAIESLDNDIFKTLSIFLECEVVSEEALNILEVLSNSSHDLSKITSSSSLLSSLLKIAETHQEQAMIILKNLSLSNEICLEMVSLNFIEKLTCFLQHKVFSNHSIFILRNICNTVKGRVLITDTPHCLASIAELLESDVPKEQENAIFILLQLCVEKIEYCYLLVREATDIYSSLLLISKNGTQEAKEGASELLRSLEEVKESSRQEEDETTVSTTSHELVMTTTQSPKKSGCFGFCLFGFKKKKR